jgi:hypothetical protein
MPPDTEVLCALRPGTVRLALRRADATPWDDLRVAGEDPGVPEMADDRHVPDYTTFESIVDAQLTWLREASHAGRGLVVMISQ